VPTADPDPYPPPLDSYLNSPAVTSKIGSHSTWTETKVSVLEQFASTGDWMRSSLSDLEMVINAGVRTVIYDGDADYICNYIGFEAMVRASCSLLPVLPAFALTHYMRRLTP
jgi:carboxypeptidase C (cathepsin A)